MLDRESKNLGEFQYPTNLTPFYLHRRCSISENVKDYSDDVWESVKTREPSWQERRPGGVFSSVLYCGLGIYRCPPKT